MKRVVCDHCGKGKSEDTLWGCLDKDIMTFNEAGEEVKKSVDLCQECYRAMLKEMVKIQTKYSQMMRRRGRTV